MTDQMQSFAPLATGVVGTLLTAQGQNNQGQDQQRLANYQAAQLRQDAGQQVAQGTQLAQDEQRKSALIASRAIAVAAASGGGALDPTVVKILQGIHGEGELAADTRMYNANENARDMTDKASATKYSGKQAAAAGRMKAISTVLNSGSQLANTWGSTPAPNSGGGIPSLESSTDFSYRPNGG